MKANTILGLDMVITGCENFGAMHIEIINT